MKVGAGIINDYKSFDKYKYPKQSSIFKKRRRMSKLKLVNCLNTTIGKELYFKTYHTCFDPNIKEKVHERKENIIFFPVTKLEILDNQNGIECRSTNDVLQFLLLPRHSSIKECCKKKH